MSFVNLESVTLADGPQLDSFNRQRISMPSTLFDAQQEYGLDTRTTWDATANGTLALPNTNGSVVNGSNAVGPRNANTRMTPITVSSTNGHYSILQSGQYPRYIPGKSHLIFITGIFAANATHTAAFTLRTATSGSASDSNKVTQANWNIDTFGAGAKNPSGKTLDLTKTQILVIDAQWLGVGRVRIGFDIDGCIEYAHEFLNANNLLLPYSQSFNLPVRLEARTGASSSFFRAGYFDLNNGIFLETESVAGGTMQFICCSVQSEGGEEARGFPQSASNGTTTIGVTTRRPVLSIRPKATFLGLTNRAHIELAEFVILAQSNPSFYEIIVGGTLTGANWLSVGTSVTAGSFVVGQTYTILTVGTTNYTLIGAASNTVGVEFTATGVGTGTGTATPTHSCAEYDVSATAISGGVAIKRGYAATGGVGSSSGASGSDIDIRNPLTLRQIDALTANQVPITIVCTSMSATSTISATMNWHEQTI